VAPPLIGITTYGRDEQGRVSLPLAYVEALRAAGAIPVLVAPGEARPEELLRRLDGLVVAGGGDFDPALYGGSPHETIYNVDPVRDRSEIALVAAAVRDGVPTLGICRGIQALNIALGGTLIEHLPDVVGEKVLHRLPPREPTEHQVRVRPGSRLAEVLGVLEFSGASWHHQAVRRAAPGLALAAEAPDGTVEGVELAGHPWCFGVQWHPELTAERDAVQRRLFAGLAAAAARNQDPGSGQDR
jgi:putative glutamine amidotransferase